MTSIEKDRLSELYLELNSDHASRREELVRQLPLTVMPPTKLNIADTPRRATRRWWLGSGVAAAVLIAGIFILQPRDAWAELVKAVRSQKWIHLVRKDLDGNVFEVWESPSAETSASRSSTEIRLIDKSASVMQVYYVNQKKLIRLEANDQEQTDSMQLFIDVLLGNAERLRHLEVSDWQKRSVTENAQTWDEIRLTVQPIGGSRMTWIVKVDPKTHLPQTFRVASPKVGELVDNQPEAEFEYPSEGPTTIAALGVPDDAEVEDRVPRDNLKAILAKMKLQRMRLGAYHLQVYYGDTSRLSRESWKDGLKFRQDLESPDICDGREFWSKHMGYWKMIEKLPNAPTQEFCRLNPQWYYLENLTYPFLSATPEFDLLVRPDRNDGPVGCILLERVATPGANPNIVHRYTPRREQYWLDPNREYALVKRVFTDVEAPEAECHSKGIPKHIETTYDDFKKSPNGVWYPTTVKTTGTLWIKQTKPMTVEPLDQHWKFSVDFKDAFPKDLFDIKAAKQR